jgi:hypothetical protein
MFRSINIYSELVKIANSKRGRCAKICDIRCPLVGQLEPLFLGIKNGALNGVPSHSEINVMVTQTLESLNVSVGCDSTLRRALLELASRLICEQTMPVRI